MQSDPQDEQRTLPDSRGGEPVKPAGNEGDGAGAAGAQSGEPAPGGATTPGSEASPRPEQAPPAGTSPPTGGVTPPRMPVPPRMPGGAAGVPTWGTSVPPAVPPPSVPPPSSAPPDVQGDPAGDDRPEAPSDPAQEAAGDSGPRSEPVADGATSEDVSGGGVSIAPRAGTRPVAPVVQGDWLASVCPYLASEDGTYRSAAPDAGHRCVAVDPPATLPLAFQERFCLTERHPRCEMYKYAQEVGQDGGIPVEAEQLRAAATRPVRNSGASAAGGGNRRPAIVAALAVGGVAILVLLLVLLLGSCSGGQGGAGDASAEPASSEAPQATEPPPTPTPEPEPTAEPDPDATPGATSPSGGGSTSTVLYQIQEGEALLKVAETFGVTRRRILRLNPGLEEIAPADLPGEVITVPVPADVPIEEIEALPGYQSPLP